jgi:osmotically-inducible protein OsmY
MVTIFPSDSNRLTDANFFIDVPTPIVAPVSQRQEADRIINNEIFRMVLADQNNDYTLSVSVNNGVVTLDVASTNRFELQRMVNEIWQLRDVEQVKNQRGVDMASTLPAVTMVP